MDDQVCPRCKTTKYRNPSLKLMVNVCGHTLCESCVDLLFLKGSGSCPECNVPLRRSNFRVQMFEDAKVEKEVDIRKKVLRDYNKKEEDFETTDDYNNYLEEIETIIYNLCNNIDIINTNKQIDQYKKENKEFIMKNKNRMGRDEYELEMELEMEMSDEQRRNEFILKEQENQKKKIIEKESLIDELMSGIGNANSIVSDYTEKVMKIQEEVQKLPPRVEFSSGVKFNHQAFLPVPKLDEDPTYTYQSVTYSTVGPTVPSQQEIESNGYLRHIRSETVVERSGGYKSIIACQRALQEALQGLFHGS